MKKFLALLFVCAGLTAMAAPQVNKADLTQVNKGQMVMKANTLTNQLTAGVSKSFMEAAKKNVQRTHADQVLNRAPKRMVNMLRLIPTLQAVALTGIPMPATVWPLPVSTGTRKAAPTTCPSMLTTALARLPCPGACCSKMTAFRLVLAVPAPTPLGGMLSCLRITS